MTLGIARTESFYSRSAGGRGEEPARIRATIARAPFFASLPISAIEDVTQRVNVRRVLAQHTVLSQGDSGDSMYLIMSGRIKVVIFGDTGREVTLSILRPGDAFGEMSLFDGEARAASCITMESCTLLVLSREDLLRHMANYPQTALNMLSEMTKRLRRADDSIAQLALCDVNERLVHKLVSLAREEGTEAPEGILVHRRPTQQELANMIGSCRETISRAFNQLARDGLIISRGRSMVVTTRLMKQNDSRRAA